MEQHATVELVPALRAPHAARAFAAETLAAWDVRAEEIEAVQLVASELVTNAVLHAAESQAVTLQLVMIDGCVRVMVSDGGRGEPERRSSAGQPVAESGRGIWIVDALADHWGTETNERGGKTVWCELSTRPATKR